MKTYVTVLRHGFVQGGEGDGEEMRGRKRRKRFDWGFFVERKKGWATVYWELVDGPVGTEGLVGMLGRGEEDWSEKEGRGRRAWE